MLFDLQAKTLESLIISLLMAHFVVDFALQSNAIAIGKCPKSGQQINWAWWMLGHTSFHGLFVLIITNSALLGFLELVSHFLIDYFKCMRKYNLFTDQMLHIGCKIIWAITCIKYM